MAKPAFGTPINTGHSLYSGMLACVHCFGNHDPYDLISAATLTKHGTGGSNASVYDGGEVSGLSDTNYWSLPNAGGALEPTTDFTVLCDCFPLVADMSRHTGDGGTPASCGGFGSPNSSGWNIQTPGGGGLQVETFNRAGFNTSAACFDTTNGGPFTRCLFRVSGSSGADTVAAGSEWFVNGSSVGVTGTMHSCPAGSTSDLLLLGTYNGGTGFFFAGPISRVIVWNRALSDADCSLVTTNATAYAYMGAAVATNVIVVPQPRVFYTFGEY